MVFARWRPSGFCFGSFSMAGVTPLSEGARDAIRSALSKEYAGTTLHKEHVVDKVVKYFGDRGTSLTEMALDVPRDGADVHERRWRARLEAADVKDPGDVVDFLIWCQSRSAPAGAGGHRSVYWTCKDSVIGVGGSR